jgi:hypothetical protein
MFAILKVLVLVRRSTRLNVSDVMDNDPFPKKPVANRIIRSPRRPFMRISCKRKSVQYNTIWCDIDLIRYGTIRYLGSIIWPHWPQPWSGGGVWQLVQLHRPRDSHAGLTPQYTRGI